MSRVKGWLKQEQRRRTIHDKVFEHFDGDLPARLPRGGTAELAKAVGCAPSGLPGVLYDLRRHGSPGAAKAWRSGYAAGRRD